MKRELSSHEIDRLLGDARATWKAAGERDDAVERKASERRLSASRRRWSMREAIPIGLCAVACVVLALLLRSGSVPKESIRPEALLAPPPVAPIVAPTQPSESEEEDVPAPAAATAPAAPAATPKAPPGSILPQLPPPAKSAPDVRLVSPPRPRKHRHPPRFGPHENNAAPAIPLPPHVRGKGRVHSL